MTDKPGCHHPRPARGDQAPSSPRPGASAPSASRSASRCAPSTRAASWSRPAPSAGSCRPSASARTASIAHLRPDWFFERERVRRHPLRHRLAPGRPVPLLHGLDRGEVVASAVGNFANPGDPGLEDFGEMLLRGDRSATGYIRVDWYTPDGLPTWGDGRLPSSAPRATSSCASTSTSPAGRGPPPVPGRRQGARHSTAPTSTSPTTGTWSATSSTAPRPRCPRPTPSRPPSWLSWRRRRRRAWATCVEPLPSGFRRGRQNWHRARRGLPVRPRRPVARGSPSRAVGAHRRAARAGARQAVSPAVVSVVVALGCRVNRVAGGPRPRGRSRRPRRRARPRGRRPRAGRRAGPERSGKRRGRRPRTRSRPPGVGEPRGARRRTPAEESPGSVPPSRFACGTSRG